MAATKTAAKMESDGKSAVSSPGKAKQTSGFLMSIVRTLSSSADFEQRGKEKKRIEKAFQESDKKLGLLVKENYQDLTSILKSFSDISDKVNESRTKIKNIKEDLSSCKTLLHCKRDELRKLWIEGVEQKTIASLLDQIEQVKNVPEKLDTHFARREYLQATNCIVAAVAKLESNLSHIEALRDLKVEILARKERMHEVLIEELNRQIYTVSSQASQSRTGSGRTGSGRHGDMSLRVMMEFSDARDDTHVEDDPQKLISSLLESLYILNKTPEAAEAIKMRMHQELIAIVARASHQLVDSGSPGENLMGQFLPRQLSDLLDIIFRQFRSVANIHDVVLANLRKIMHEKAEQSGVYIKPESMYTKRDVWSKIQAVTELLLNEYLDVRNTVKSRQQAPSNYEEATMDIGTYFTKKKTQKQKKGSLFRFDASIHALSTNSYVEDTHHFESELFGGGTMHMDTPKHVFVCKPSVDNIRSIYKQLQIFIKEVESSSALQPGESSLNEFVKNFVEDTYLGHIHYVVSNNIDIATKVDEEEESFDALRNVIDHKTQKELGVPRPLLQSTVTVDKSVSELKDLMTELPDYADQFLNMICNVLRGYRDTCHNAYRGIVQYDADEKRVISAMWAKDEDISRFLRSLPSWRTLQPTNGQELNRTVCSEEEMRALNSKEAVILITNLSSDEAFIPQHEIITDVTQMRTVANVHESLEWFAVRLKNFSITKATQASQQLVVESPVYDSSPKVSQKTLESLNGIVKDFQDLSEVCLLLLHLEVRVHCFYYLMPVAKQSNYAGPIDDLDPDSNVLKLNKDLSGIEELLAASLQPSKFKYIFESLGYLVASILMNSMQFIKKINENGIKKMCRNLFAIQQNLTNITMSRESDLDHARQYYELLYLNPEKILTLIAEKGSQFTLAEYSQLLQLYHRSHFTVDQAVVDAHLKRLREVTEKGHNETV
ncbi:exocyst complex component 4-like isoform X2 [Dreissena polymorpha]|uniref:exocyst complex component 4-like isoform X2 n=1 Tax=Dreissena polymorpha TaxID=45954 RepID=UPI002264CB47|nr:exocyst complex component 4-like isoform X2 [Dreissena polymorpha]